MQVRTFGRSELCVPEIAFGCGPTAKLMIGDDRQLRLRAVARALELGVNYFDTAAAYGQGRSETNLGDALRELGASPIIATKVTIEEADFGDLAGAVTRSIDGSLNRLGIDRVDIVHLHNRFGAHRAARSPFGSGAQLTADDAEVVAESLDTLRERGKVDLIGCCAFGGEPPAVRRVIHSGGFDSIILNYSLLNQSAWAPANPDPAVQDYGQVGAYAAARGIATVALRVLEGGALAGGAQNADAERVQTLGFLATGPNRGLVESAIRFALSNTQVSTVVVGFSNLEQIEEAVAAANKGPLSEAQLARLETLRQTDFGRRA